MCYQFIFFVVTALLKFDKVTDFAGNLLLHNSIPSFFQFWIIFIKMIYQILMDCSVIALYDIPIKKMNAILQVCNMGVYSKWKVGQFSWMDFQMLIVGYVIVLFDNYECNSFRIIIWV